MAINFPSSPTQGQVFSRAGQPVYTWDTNKWIVTGPAPPYEAEATAIFNAFTTPATQQRKGDINELVKGLKTAGLWTKFDALYLEAAADAQAASINWKQPGTFNTVEVNSPAFTVDRGFNNPGTTSYLDTGINLTLTPGQLTVTNCSFLGWNLANAAQPNTVLFGNASASAPGVCHIMTRDASNITHGRLNNSTNVNQSIGNTWDGRGFFSGSRTTGAVTNFYFNGQSRFNAGHAAGTFYNSNLMVLRWGSTSNAYSQSALVGVAVYLTPAEHATLYTILQTYLAAVGAIVVDTVAPVVTAFSPADNATNVGIADWLSVTFDKIVMFGTSGTIDVKRTSDNSLVESFDIATEQGTGAAGKMEIVNNGLTVTLHPTTQWPANTELYVVATAGALKDTTNNNPVNALTSTTAWSFTTTAASTTSIDLDLTDPAVASQLTCVRATHAYGERLDGIWQRFEANVPRITDKGLLVEATGRSNSMDWSRDLTNVAWSKTNTTVAKDQTGIDGLANSACSITATAAAGTCVNNTSSSSGQRTFYAWIKRISGTGTVELVCQNGVYEVVVPTATWARYFIHPASNVGSGNSGFRLGTIGDVIAVDFCALESGDINESNASTPFETTTAAGTRDMDLVTVNLSQRGMVVGPTGTLFVQAVPRVVNADQDIICVDDGSIDNRTLLRKKISGDLPAVYHQIASANVGFGGTSVGALWTNLTRGRMAMSYSNGSQIGTKDGGAGATFAVAGAQAPMATWRLGNNSASSAPFAGWIERATLWTAQKTLAELQDMTAPAPYDFFTVPPTLAKRKAIDTCMASLKTGGVWAKLDELQVWMAADAQASLVNWKAPGTYNGTAINAPPFQADQGYRGGGTAYIDSGFNPTTAPTPKFTQNDASIFAWITSVVGDASARNFGMFTDTATLITPRSAGTVRAKINSSAVATQFATSSSVGFVAGVRTGAALAKTYKDGVELGNPNDTSNAPANENLIFLASGATYWAGVSGIGGFGSQLSAAEMTSLYNALLAYRIEVAATDVFKAFTVPPSAARQALIRTLVTTLVTNNVWDKLDTLYLNAAADAQAALVNWKDPNLYNAVAVNAPAFTVDRGFTGDGVAAYIDSYNPTLQPINYNRDNATAFIWSNTAGVPSVSMGTSTGHIVIGSRGVGDVYNARCNNTALVITGASTDGSGLWSVARPSGSLQELYKNGALLNSNAGTSLVIPSMTVWFLHSGSSYSAAQVSAGGMSAYLSATDQLTLYNALRAYMTGVGVP